MRRNTIKNVLLGVVLVVLGAVGWYVSSSSADQTADERNSSDSTTAVAALTGTTVDGGVESRGTAPKAAPETANTSEQAPVSRFSDLPLIEQSQLPAEAKQTLELIKTNGPFPYRKDGSVFQNRERLLPNNKRGYYREYTVKTPGERDRGARRIVAGPKGERYYTSDHYASFQEVSDDG